MKNYLLLALAAVALCFTACKKDNPVTGISLDKTMVALEIGDSDTLTATVAPDDATNKDVDWSVADDAIATVEDGVVKAVAAGQTTVTVTTVDGGFTASATITVAESIIKVTGISLDKTMVALEIGDSDTLTATVAPDNAKNKGVEWSVADDAIATVEDGVVKAVAIGETTVTVTTVDGGFTASATITVVESIIKVTGVTLDKPALELEIGDSDTLTATVAPDDATNKGVEWSVADDAIATVEDGVVKAVAAGQTTVTVTTVDGGFTASANVVVKAAPIKVTGVSLDKTMVYLEIDESATVQAVITPSNATNKAVEWSVADATIASVNNGEVKGLKEGETTLTATTADGGFTATIPVKVVTEKVAVTGIEWQNTTSNIKEGKFTIFVAEISPANATDLSTTWMSDNPEVASIGEIKIADNFIMAYIWGVAPGEATISVTTNDGGFKRDCPITIDPAVKVTKIKIGPENATIEVGETKQFAAAISPSDAENKEVEWSSSDTDVATIDANGLVTGVGKGTATITATAKDGSGVKGETTITVVGKKPTSITFDGTAPYEFYYWQGKVIDFKNDLKMKVEPADADLSRIELSLSIESARDDVSGEEVKYEVKDDNITLSYAHSTHWVAKETVHATAYVDGYLEIGSVSIIMQNRGVLFYSSTGLSYYYDLAMQGNKMNWNNDNITKLKYICYNKTVGTGSIPSYDKYQIPSSEYTLTSSDPSKIKVTKNDDGISWMVERLNTTDLVAVTLTYKCGNHTQTYTINLIP